jgi:fumarylacetoacetate (FAA) hydrolase
MKLATYKDGSRDGQLVVVSRDLSTAHYATGIANKLQQVLDDWNFLSPQLQDLYDALNRVGDATSSASKARHAFPFDPQQCMAPVPRAYQRVEGWAYLNHVELLRKAGDLEVLKCFDTDPPLYQSASDDLLGPCDDVVCASEALGIDFEAELAVITGDVRLGATPAQALDGIRLLMLANQMSLRHLVPTDHGPGIGFFQSKTAAAFSPVAVTVDELGDAWDKGRLHLTLQSSWNGRKVGMCDAGAQMTFHFGQLIAQFCKNHKVRAGTIIGSGAVSNKDLNQGYSCIAEKRAIEILQGGKPVTDFMKYGDIIRIEMRGRDGLSLFGAIEQQIVPFENAKAV